MPVRYAKSLPIGLNRISWKPFTFAVVAGFAAVIALPIGLNRISWKHSLCW